MEERHRKDGIALLAVSLDGPETRPKIPAFLKKHGIQVRVLLGDPEELRGYDTRVASSLYLIDKKGVLAGVPSEFYFKMERQLEARLPDLLAGKPAPGPLLWAVEKAPPGLSILWKREPGAVVTALAVAPSGKGRPAEIGVLDEAHLTRYSPSGDHLGDAPVEAKDLYLLRGADLDGDGKNEWILGGEESFTLLDGAGEEYWQYLSDGGRAQVVGFLDLDGDGLKEILIQESVSVVAKKLLPGILWKTPPLGVLRSVVPVPPEKILVQTSDGIGILDRSGQYRKAPGPGSGGTVLQGRIDRGGGRALDLFGHSYGPRADVEHDLDGDGRKDITTVTSGAVAVYSQEGSPLLILRVTSNQLPPPVALADLDGRPGDEMILFIPDYGLVALGISPEAKPLDGTAPPTGEASSPER